MKLSMRLHRIRLWMLRNRNDILIIITLTSLLTILVLQGIMLTAIYNQSRRNEDILKGLSCILLINPTSRNQENVQGCVDINHSDESNKFEFKPPEKKIQINAPKSTTRQITPKTQTVPEVKATPQPQPVVENPICPPSRPIEYLTDPTGVVKFKCQGDALWQT